MKTKGGFTVVEILVVIVVIGILAAISIVAYNGIQTRAFNTRIIDGVGQYRDALSVYKSQRGGYPAFTDGSVCLGEGYPDRMIGGTTDGVPDCGPTDYPSKVQPGFNDALKLVISSTPQVQTAPVYVPWTNPPVEYVGAQLTYWTAFTVDGVSTPYFITYVIKGDDADCKLSGIVRTDDSGGGWPHMKSGAFKNTWSDTTVNHTTSCTLPLPN